jgi:hypothetical protein
MAALIDVIAAEHEYDHAAAAERYRKHFGLS